MAFLERPFTPGLLDRAGADRHLGELITRDCNRLIRVPRRDVTPHVFSEDCCGGYHRVVAAFGTGHTGQAGRILVVALTRGNSVPVTPCPAQQGEVLPNCQRKDDRKQNCSEHVILVASREQEQGPINLNAKAGKTLRFLAFQAPLCGISPPPAENPAPSLGQGGSERGLRGADE